MHYNNHKGDYKIEEDNWNFYCDADDYDCTAYNGNRRGNGE